MKALLYFIWRMWCGRRRKEDASGYRAAAPLQLIVFHFLFRCQARVILP